MFHQLDGLTVQEQQAENVREFVGDGTPYLKVPGLKDQPKSVRLGHTFLPMTITQDFPTGIPGRLESVTSPLYILQHQADGMPVLLRSQQSNDGVWQKDVPVFVQGDWEDSSPLTRAGITVEEAERLDAEEKAKANAEAVRLRAEIEAQVRAEIKAEEDAKAKAGK